MIKPYYILIDSPLSQSALFRLCTYMSKNPSDQIHFIFINSNLDQAFEVKLYMCFALKRAQNLSLLKRMQIKTWSLKAFFTRHNFQQQGHNLLVPQRLSFDTGLDLEISDDMEKVLAEYTEFVLSEELLELALEQPVEEFPDLLHLKKEVQALLHDLLQGQGCLEPQTLAYLFQLQLHQAPLSQEFRSTLQQALQQLMKCPEKIELHFILAAFRRRFVELDTCLRDWPEHQVKTLSQVYELMEQWVSIYPPPPNWKVSIVIPTYNRAAELREALQCVLQQTYTDWELHIVDDASQDQTQKVCQAFVAQDPRIHYHRNPENWGFFGIHKTCRKMADASDCGFIAFLADDDRWEPFHLEQLIKRVKQSPWVSSAFSPMWLVKNKTEIVGQFGPFEHLDSIVDPEQELQRALVLDMCPVGAIMRPGLVAEFAEHDITSARHFGETYAAWDYMLHVKLLSHYEMAYSPQVSVRFNVGGETGSKSWDAVSDLFYMLNELINDYQKLFDGNEPPAYLIRHFVQRRIESLTLQFHNNLHNVQSADEWPDFVTQRKPIWQKAADYLLRYPPDSD